MAYLGEAFDTHLAAACGDDHALFAELRAAFLESAERQLDLVRRARCDGNWLMAIERLRGLAASFADETLLALTDEALGGAPGEPSVPRRIGAYLAELAGEG